MRIEIENYRMMLGTRVDLVCLREAELVLVFKALSVLFISFFLGTQDTAREETGYRVIF